MTTLTLDQTAFIRSLRLDLLLYAVRAAPCPAFAAGCVAELERRAEMKGSQP